MGSHPSRAYRLAIWAPSVVFRSRINSSLIASTPVERTKIQVLTTYSELSKHFLLRLELEESLLVVARDHTAASLALELLEALCTAEPVDQMSLVRGFIDLQSLKTSSCSDLPSRMIPGEPALRDAVAPL